MIEPEAAARWRSEERFDRIATVLIGLVAVLAAILLVLQTADGQESTRAQVQAARLASDASARISASSLARDSLLVAQQGTLVRGMEAISRMLAGTRAGDDDVVGVGTATQGAAEKLGAILAATEATIGGRPLDAYTAGLVRASTAAIATEVAEQGHQVDLANDAGARQMRAILGLSFLALAGVLAGLAAVLREGRAGWGLLGVAWGVAGAAALVTVLTVA